MATKPHTPFPIASAVSILLALAVGSAPVVAMLALSPVTEAIQ